MTAAGAAEGTLMSKVPSSKQLKVVLPRAERRRRAREARRKLEATELRQLLVDEGLTALAHQTGLEALATMMEEDIDRACGVRGKWEQNPEGRLGSRNGRGFGAVWIGGRLLQIDRPRAVYAGGREIAVESYQAAQNPEFLSNAVLTATVLGVSLRNHAAVVGAINPIAPDRETSGLSKSTIGRRFLAAADSFLDHFLNRRLDERYLVVWVDAIAEGDYAVLAAVGLTEGGVKKVLGLRQGSTETSDFCREFIEELQGRGLSAHQGLLWVVDGGPGMACALREIFGPDVLIQRCRVHKKRNVLDKLTLWEDEKKSVAEELDRAWALEDPVLARATLELLARSLESRGQRAAAASLREGHKQMLTCCQLGLPLELMASLTNTNVIESTFSIHEAVARRVKRWRNGKQVLRWVAAASYKAEKAFGRVGNFEALSKLASALERYVPRKAIADQTVLALAS